jgi:hypothetical protein
VQKVRNHCYAPPPNLLLLSFHKDHQCGRRAIGTELSFQSITLLIQLSYLFLDRLCQAVILALDSIYFCFALTVTNAEAVIIKTSKLYLHHYYLRPARLRQHWLRSQRHEARSPE